MIYLILLPIVTDRYCYYLFVYYIVLALIYQHLHSLQYLFYLNRMMLMKTLQNCSPMWVTQAILTYAEMMWYVL
uniref:Secreted protein n=1 Tax=Panstrongylus lignarius TaxID=156445 RepID=A0A224Y612_9HEMI